MANKRKPWLVPVSLSLAIVMVGALAVSLATALDEPEHPDRWARPPVGATLELSSAEWHQRLSAAEYRVLREAGTERAFTGRFHDHHAEGTYRCAGCGQPLFLSRHKFDSGTGWPSFDRPVAGRVRRETDRSLGVTRTEVLCGRCGGHLGHVFDDGPPTTGLRYCVNSISLDFEGSGQATEHRRQRRSPVAAPRGQPGQMPSRPTRMTRSVGG